MFWDDTSSKNKKKKQDPLDLLETMEMCDICCKSYYCNYITRIKYVNKQGIIFTIRKCPYCDINSYTKFL